MIFDLNESFWCFFGLINKTFDGSFGFLNFSSFGKTILIGFFLIFSSLGFVVLLVSSKFEISVFSSSGVLSFCNFAMIRFMLGVEKILRNHFPSVSLLYVVTKTKKRLFFKFADN